MPGRCLDVRQVGCHTGLIGRWLFVCTTDHATEGFTQRSFFRPCSTHVAYRCSSIQESEALHSGMFLAPAINAKGSSSDPPEKHPRPKQHVTCELHPRLDNSESRKPTATAIYFRTVHEHGIFAAPHCKSAVDDKPSSVWLVPLRPKIVHSYGAPRRIPIWTTWTGTPPPSRH